MESEQDILQKNANCKYLDTKVNGWIFVHIWHQNVHNFNMNLGNSFCMLFIKWSILILCFLLEMLYLCAAESMI